MAVHLGRLGKQQPMALLRFLSCVARRQYSGVTMPSPSKLGDILKLEDMEDKTGEEIGNIWLKYHLDGPKGRVAGVMSSMEYRALATRAKSSPLFALPLCKPGGGYLTMLWQAQLPYILFTTVEEYRKYGAGSPPHFTLTLYDELAERKDVVLIRGDIINDRVLAPGEGRTLLELSRAFYVDPVSFLHVHSFNHEPDKFDFGTVLQEIGYKPAAQPEPEAS